ncbi:MAG: thioredoxin domain-containing protein [Candidatus Gracilibacteria bacterium]|nr:thioredoxin domain-containing protein [Candidatus Gracilibacteria bacterium]MDQ7022739.1 thioredoxin domain-containing protein [Candidatus Gracilibacteria bacterium]
MENKKSTNYTGILAVIVILLLVVIGEVYYFNNNSISKSETVSKIEIKNELPEIVIISDKRCGEECNTTPIITQLKQIPSLSSVEIKTIDYSTQEAKDMMKESGIKLLPAVIFSNDSTKELAGYLKATNNNKFSLVIPAAFDPTAKMSDKGFKILDKKVLEEIKSNSYLKGNKDAKVTWIEYSDLECPFCAKLHNSGTPEELREKYGKDLNQVFQSFPLDFHKNALPGAEAIECLGKEKGSEAYYNLVDISFKNKNSDTSFLIDEAVKLGANKDTITKCIDAKTFDKKIKNQQATGTREFGVTGTPGNVLINNETGEYEVISGAYPTDAFVKIIDRLLK